MEPDAEHFFIEESSKLSESRIWPLLEDYYKSASISAWNQIPFYPTSNPFIAETYADIILNFVRDYKENIDFEKPLYILEMAAGTGCFSFYLLKELKKRKEYFPWFKQLNLQYIMADFTAENQKNWNANPRFTPFRKEGWLQFGVFKPQDDLHVIEAESGTVLLDKSNCANPLIAIANYFFDSIKQDAFQVDQHKLLEVKQRFQCKRDPEDPAAIKFETMHKTGTETYLEVGVDYYEDARMNNVLKDYVQSFESASIIFPLGAFNCISNLLAISSDNLVLISSDKGFTDENYVKGRREQPFVAHHGIFSYSVNYDAIRRYFLALGGASMNTTDDNLSVSTAVNFLLAKPCELAGSRFNFEDKVDRQNLSNYLYFMQDLLIELEPKKSNEVLRACMGYVQLCNYDPIVFCLAAPRIYFGLETITSSQAHRLLEIIARVRENFFSVQQQYDVFYWIGRIYYGMSKLEDALKAFADSLLTFGASSSALYYTAACYEVKQEYKTALRYYKDTLELEPGCEFTQGGIKRVEALLLGKE